jgi:hypothetical protein
MMFNLSKKDIEYLKTFIEEEKINKENDYKEAAQKFFSHHPELKHITIKVAKNFIEKYVKGGFEKKETVFIKDVNLRKHPELDTENDPPIKISAPYRFIPLSDTVLYPDSIHSDRSHSRENLSSRLNASISVEWIAESPLLIGHQEPDIKRNGETIKGDVVPLCQPGRKDNYVIPGSTLRGLIRSAAEIIALAKVGFINGHQHYGVRDPVHPLFSEIYKISQNSSRKEGTLQCKNGDPENEEETWIFRDDTDTEYELSRSTINKFRTLHSTFSEKRPVPKGRYAELLGSLSNKERVDVFYVGDPAFQENNFWFGFQELFKLPHINGIQSILDASHPSHNPKFDQGEYKPDFIENIFGYVIEQGGKSHALKGRVSFGTASLKENQAPRVQNGMPMLCMTPAASYSPFYLAEKKKGAPLDYSSDATSVQFAGRKRYLPRFPHGSGNEFNQINDLASKHIEATTAANKGKALSEKISSHLRFLVSASSNSPLVFESEIKLRNVTPEELGAILYALTHGGDVEKRYRHMVGRAKPYGAGQIRIASARLVVKPNLHSADNQWCRPPEESELLTANSNCGFCPKETKDAPSYSHHPFLRSFIDYVRKRTDFNCFPKIPQVEQYLGVSDPEVGAKLMDADRLSYMTLPHYGAVKNAYKWHKEKSPAPIRAANAKNFDDCKMDTRLLPAPKGVVPPVPGEDP